MSALSKTPNACPPSAAAVLARAIALHVQQGGRRPIFAACAPGRVNLIGEHTDYNLGFALPMAIDRWCVAVASPAQKSHSTVRSEATSGVLAFDGRSATPQNCADSRWAAYAVGATVLTQRAIALGGAAHAPELDITIASDVPLGSGLSSSAAVEVACARLALSAAGANMPCRDLAKVAQTAEHEFAGVPCGLMDQLASACSKPGHVMLIDFQSLETRHLPAPKREQACVVIANSGVRHALASGEYAERRAACTNAARYFGVSSLREFSTVPDGVEGLDDHTLACVRHVISENARTLAAARALEQGDLTVFGSLMFESHRSLRDDFRVSCKELDALVEIARACPGVLGARMTGGGFGGCIVALVHADAEMGFRSHLQSAYRAQCHTNCMPFVACPDGGAMTLDLSVLR